jgi:hypothetical protein
MSLANISIAIGLLGLKRDFVLIDHKRQSKKKIQETERMSSGTGLLLYCSIGI